MNVCGACLTLDVNFCQFQKQIHHSVAPDVALPCCRVAGTCQHWDELCLLSAALLTTAPVDVIHGICCQPVVPLLLQSQIQKKMTTEMVEPKRKYVDIEAVWKKQRLKKKAGPGGLLSVTLVQARDLRSVHEGCMRA